jgi:hypothetical protein
MKIDKIICEAILLKIFNFLLHHIANAKNAKDIYNNFYATYKNNTFIY